MPEGQKTIFPHSPPAAIIPFPFSLKFNEDMDKDHLVEIKLYWQTCWQLLHTSLHSLSTFFSFMMEKRKDNPQSFCHCFLLLGFGSPSSPLSFEHFQIQCDGLSLHLDFSCSSAWIPVCELKQSFAPLFLFPLRVPSVVWVWKAHSPCFSILIKSLLAVRGLHSACYSFLKSSIHHVFRLLFFLSRGWLPQSFQSIF